MSLATLPLPDDPTELRDLAVDLQAELARKDIEIAANAAEIHAKTLHIEKLKMQLAVLRRARFGRSSEKLDHAIEQLELLIGELEADAGAVEARDTAGDADAGQPVKRRERQHPVRKPLPPHLPRETITHEAACTCPGCGGTVFSRIGQDEREVLEYVPSSFKVIRHIRPKLSCRACETIVQPPMPSLPIERGRPVKSLAIVTPEGGFRFQSRPLGSVSQRLSRWPRSAWEGFLGDDVRGRDRRYPARVIRAAPAD